MKSMQSAGKNMQMSQTKENTDNCRYNHSIKYFRSRAIGLNESRDNYWQISLRRDFNILAFD